MKKTSNWLLAAIIGGVLVVCLIAIGTRLNRPGLPVATMTYAPQDSQTPATVTDPPSPTPTLTDPAETPALATASPSPTAEETATVESPTPATTSPEPTPTAADPVETPVTATASPSPASTPVPTEPDPVESEEPAGFIGPLVLVVEADYIIDVVDLGAITESYTKVYDSIFGGSNTVEFVPGDARVIEATCPDHVCITEGWVVADMGGFLPVACLPNSMMLYAMSAEELMGTGVDGATQ